jgi:hypothetical protein
VDLAAVKILLMHLVATEEEGTARRGRQGRLDFPNFLGYPWLVWDRDPRLFLKSPFPQGRRSQRAGLFSSRQRNI